MTTMYYSHIRTYRQRRSGLFCTHTPHNCTPSWSCWSTLTSKRDNPCRSFCRSLCRSRRGECLVIMRFWSSSFNCFRIWASLTRALTHSFFTANCHTRHKQITVAHITHKYTTRIRARTNESPHHTNHALVHDWPDEDGEEKYADNPAYAFACL